LDLGDARRNLRLIKLVDDLSAQPTGSIPLACGGWAETKAAYRLLDNPALDWQEILEVHTERTCERIREYPVVLCLQDTTELDFSSQPGIAGLGRLNYEARQGLYLHPTLVVTPTGVALGVVDAWIWARGPKDQPQVKESTRWVEGYEIVADLAERTPGTRLVYVADREGDLRELMDTAARRGTPADWLLRAKHNRTTLGATSCGTGWVRANPWRSGIHVAGRARPAGTPGTANAIPPSRYLTSAQGRARPDGNGDPSAGRESTSWRKSAGMAAAHQPPGRDLEAIVELIDWYRRRWLIEIFFRILKSGCRVEALQLGTLERLERALVIYLIIAWRILHLVTWGRECPDLPCEVVFDPEECQAAWIVAYRRPPPDTPPNLSDMVRLIAGFGGFLGRKHDGHPGPKAIWEGMQKVRAFAMALEAGKAAYTENG